mgnify:FL=1|tara:strand:+ start:6788 stop:7375 length:588 start_codon:yes stop_codon:yes gene_type:complete
MASNIVSDTIDGTYPVAGIDNDTQGFRDNFTIIKAGLAVANTEITDLQANTAKTNVTTSYNNNTIENVNVKAGQRESIETNVVGETNLTLSFNSGHYFRLTNVNNPVTINFDDWPETSNYAEMVVHFNGNGSGTQAVTFASPGSTNIYVDNGGAWTNRSINVPASADQSIKVRAWTHNNGDDVYIEYQGQFVTTV